MSVLGGWGRWAVGGALGLLLLGRALTAGAVPVTISDPYGVGSPDVLGEVANFDIEKIVFTSLTSSNVTAQIYVNYHSGDTTLSPWQPYPSAMPTLWLNVGDLIFTSGSDQYVVPLKTLPVDRPSFTAGQLYSVTSLRTAQDVLNNPSGVVYRPTQNVWGGGTPTAIAPNLGVTVACASGSPPSLGICPSAGELVVTVQFDPNDAFWNDLNGPNYMHVHFASATCGNDVIDGVLAPEPGTLLLLGTGLVGLGAVARRRLRRRK